MIARFVTRTSKNFYEAAQKLGFKNQPVMGQTNVKCVVEVQ